MNRLFATTVALGLLGASGAAFGQSYLTPRGNYDNLGGPVIPDRYAQERGAHYDYARVLRVDPVLDDYRPEQVNGQRCYQRDTYVDAGHARGSDSYYPDNYPDNRGGYGNHRYQGSYGGHSAGSQGGRTIATVVGGVLGAVVGNQVGGGSGRYVTSAIGSMVGGIAGREIYEQQQRSRRQVATTRVCDPVSGGSNYATGNYGTGNYRAGDRAVSAYDVTYDYAGRSYVTRTDYHPGDRIRVRVDVRPE